jgi:transposase
MARIVDAIGRVRGGALSCVDAAALLGISERHFRRLRDAYLEGGAEAIIDKRRGRPAPNKAPDKIADWVAEQYRAKYFDFTARHFHEALKKEGLRYGYTWTKSVLYLRGLLKPVKTRGPHRRKRPRSPLPGMLVFQDGSSHDWFSGRRAPCDLIVTLDDATGAILSAFFVEEEGTASSFRGLQETIEKYGLFSSFYTDRGSHYFYTAQAGEKVDKDRLTQVGRALSQLGIVHIPSYAPEGRGRMERLFGTRATAGCRKSCGLRVSMASKPPMAGWFAASFQSSTGALPSSQKKKERPSCPLWVISKTSSASMRSGWWARIIACVTRAACCKSQSRRIGATT